MKDWCDQTPREQLQFLAEAITPQCKQCGTWYDMEYREGEPMMVKQCKCKPKYWYKIYIYYCPVCGNESKSQERQYTPRPENYDDRVEVQDRYDGCDGCMDDYY